jgi:C-terminal processing protease CtpA/Prc
MKNQITFISLILVFNLSFTQEPVKTFSDYIKSNDTKDYLNDAVDILKENSINKYTLDWESLRNQVLEMGKNANNIKETYPAIQYALFLLGDNHSLFMTPEEYKSYKRPDLPIPSITSELINNNIGFIKIPGFRGSGNEPAEKFAQQIQNKIKELDEFNIQLWIVDLEDNTGGNVWPMLLGLAPLLGEGIMGYLVDADSNYFNWGISKGEVFYNDDQANELPNPYRLNNKIEKLAVIIGPETASAGEAIAVSFKGAENSCFIGSPTRGKSTGNTGYDLSDGARIYVTRTKFADRNKNIYGVPIKPDIEVSYGHTKEAAINWINKK